MLKYIRIFYLILFLIFLQGCSCNKFIVDKKKFQKEAFIRPPSNFLARNIKFDSDGNLRDDKSILIINKFDLPVKTPEPNRFSLKKRIKSKRSGFGETWVRETQDSIKNGLLEKPLNIYLYFTGKEINFYTVWNYKALYNENDSLNKFDISKTIKTIDELRIIISDLTYKGKDILNADFDNINLNTNLKNTNPDGEGIMLAEGLEQELLNYFFGNLTLPLSISLYNYGYVDEVNSSHVERPAYFLDNHFSLSVFYHTPTNFPDNEYTTHVFHSAKTFSLYKEKDKLHINQQWPYDWKSSQIREDTIGSVSIDLITPSRFFEGGKKYFVLYAASKDLRTHENGNNFYFRDLMLIGLDSIDNYFELKYNHNPFGTIMNLKNKGDLFYIDDNLSTDRRLFYEISFNIYLKRPDTTWISETIPFGFSYSKFIKGSKNKIKRLNTNKRYKKIKTTKRLDLSEIQILLNPYDKIEIQ